MRSPAGSADAVADAMEAAIDASDETIAAMGREGHRRVAEQHDAVHLGHPQVRDDQVRTEARDDGERPCGAVDGLDFVFLRAQADGQEAQQARILASGVTWTF